MSSTKMQFPLVYRVKTPDGWRWFAPIIRQLKVFVIDRGQECHYPGGKFYLRYWQDGQRRFEPVNYNMVVLNEMAMKMTADRARKELQKRLQAGDAQGRQTLRTKADAYLIKLRQDRHPEMAKQAEYVFKDWPVWSRSITGQDVSDWFDLLRSQELSERTIKNRYVILKHFLKYAEVTVPKLPRAPKIGKKKPRVCEDDQMTTLLASCDPYTRLVVEMGRQLGLRKRELMHAAWSDISWSTQEITVTEKPDVGFTVKNRKERTQQVPPNLIALLKEWQTHNVRGRFILGTRNDKPNHSLLNRLKAAVIDAGLPPEEFSLHMLRRKFATTLHNQGVPLATVSEMLDHSNISTTAAYLGIEGRKEQAAHVTRIFG